MTNFVYKKRDVFFQSIHKELNLNELPAKVQSPRETTTANRGETPRTEKLAFGASSIVLQALTGFPWIVKIRRPF